MDLERLRKDLPFCLFDLAYYRLRLKGEILER
jgi:hypothetical protein